MKFELRPARRGEIYGRVLIFSESGQGKTFTALAIAFHLAELYGYDPSVIGVLDTETVESADREDSGTGSAEKYTGRPCNCNRCHRQGLVFEGFQTMIMESGHRGPEAFMRALEVCKQAGIQIVILDGITDEWRSLLQIVDQIKAQSRGKNDGWATARPLHNQFVEAVLSYPGHVIATCRAKKESRHKQAEEGMGDVLPDQDGNVVYEYDVALFMKRGHGHVVKTRDDRLENAGSRHPGADLAEGLKRWCDDPKAKTESAAASGAKRTAERVPTTAPNTRTDATRPAIDNALSDPAVGDALLKENGGDGRPQSSSGNGGGQDAQIAHVRQQVVNLIEEVRVLGQGKVADQAMEHMRKWPKHVPTLAKLRDRLCEVRDDERAKLAEVTADSIGDEPDPEEGFDLPF